MENIRKLREEKEYLQIELNDVKESAIEAIVEREKEIIELKYKINDIENNFNNQIDYLNSENCLLKEKIDKLSEKENKFFDQELEVIKIIFTDNNYLFNIKKKKKGNLIEMKNELENYKIKMFIELDNKNQVIKELTENLESQQLDFEEKLSITQHELNDKFLERLGCQYESVKNMENDLLNELRKTEEKLRSTERNLFEIQVQKNEEEIKSDKILKEFNEIKEKMTIINEEKHKLTRKCNKFDNKFSELKKNYDSEINKLQKKINVFERGQEKNSKLIERYDAEKKKFTRKKFEIER